MISIGLALDDGGGGGGRSAGGGKGGEFDAGGGWSVKQNVQESGESECKTQGVGVGEEERVGSVDIKVIP